MYSHACTQTVVRTFLCTCVFKHQVYNEQWLILCSILYSYHSMCVIDKQIAVIIKLNQVRQDEKLLTAVAIMGTTTD